MEEIHQKTLQRNWAFLVKNLHLNDLKDELISEEIMSFGQWENIESKAMTNEKVGTFLDTYTRCGPEAYDILEKILNGIPRCGYITEQLRTTYVQLLREGNSLKKHGFVQNSKDIYPIGPMRILIINNEFTKQGKMERTGSDQDVKNLQKIFVYLGHTDITTLVNQDAKNVNEQIDTFLEDEKTKKAASCVLVVSSHGDEHGVISFNKKDDFVYKKSFIEKFSRRSAKYLVGKPKLLMFQCCRGADVDDGKSKKHSGDQGAKPNGDHQPDAWKTQATEASSADGETVSDANPVSEGKVSEEIEACHNVADMLIVDATSDGEKSWRSIDSGSLMIKHFCDVTESRWKNEHMADILTKVTHELGAGFDLKDVGPVMQQVTTTDTLRRKWYLRPN